MAIENHKTVYFLGAGFSISAGAPSQRDIINFIDTNLRKSTNSFVQGAISSFDELVINVLSVQKTRVKNLCLEDILTPIDRCIKENVPLKSLNANRLLEIKEKLYFLIALAIREHIAKSQNKYKSRYIDLFASHLISLSKARSGYKFREGVDPVAVISTNWDILLDQALYLRLKSKKKTPPVGVIDYCCKISSFDEFDDFTKPGLELLATGDFCVKMLKIHGSLNWLLCPMCQRTYAGGKVNIALFRKQKCRHCAKKTLPSGDLQRLRGNLVMPTYIKELNNIQYQMIWHQAALELSEAKEIIFIGYSLPPADYEIRQLLTRMVQPTTSIKVVTLANSVKELNSKIEPYESFFGRSVKAYGKGVEKYILEEISTQG